MLGCPCCDASIIIYVVLGVYVATKAISKLPIHENLRKGLNFTSYLTGALILGFSIFLVVLQRDDDLRSWAFAKLCQSMTKAGQITERRCSLLQQAGVHGVMVEIGTGPGTNFKCWGNATEASTLAGNAISTYIGAEPNKNFANMIKEEKAVTGIPFQVNMLFDSGASLLDVTDGSVDVVVGTHLLCSVQDVDAILREIGRVLRPGGKYYFMEHVLTRDEGSMLYLSQLFIAPLFNIVGNGCKFSTTWKNLEAHADIFDLDFVDWDAPLPIPMIRPHILGTATRR